MSSNSIITIVKMVESLPDDLQEQVRTYISDLEEEAKWKKSFENTPASLTAAARQAKREIAEGKSTPMDYDRL